MFGSLLLVVLSYKSQEITLISVKVYQRNAFNKNGSQSENRMYCKWLSRFSELQKNLFLFEFGAPVFLLVFALCRVGGSMLIKNSCLS